MADGVKGVKVIAEIGVNHNGDPALARELIDASAEAGADFVKFQAFRADALTTAGAGTADYQARRGFSGSQRRMLESLELDAGELEALAGHAREAGVGFLASHFDAASLELLVRLEVPWLKVPSGEITNFPLLLATARAGIPVLLSTGMATLGEVEEALDVLLWGWEHPQGVPGAQELADLAQRGEGRWPADRLVVFQCTTEYPTPPEEANVRVVETLKRALGTPVGLSDHTDGVRAAVLAVALGATWIEKHVTLDRSMEGPDHAASANPAELAELVEAVAEARVFLGSPTKEPTVHEEANRAVVRRSVVAARPIAAGAVIAPEDLAVKRPGGGLHPRHLWELAGRTADRDYETDEPLSPEVLQ